MNSRSIVCLKASKFLPAMRLLHWFQPAVWIALVFERHGRLRQFQWTERIDHDGKFLGARLANRSFVGARMRAVRDTVGMNRERSRAHAAARHEIALHVVDHFV